MLKRPFPDCACPFLILARASSWKVVLVRPTCSVQKPPAQRGPHSGVRDGRPRRSSNLCVRRSTSGPRQNAGALTHPDGAATQGALQLRLAGRTAEQSGLLATQQRFTLCHASRQPRMGVEGLHGTSVPWTGAAEVNSASVQSRRGALVCSFGSKLASRAASSIGLARSSHGLEPKPTFAHLVSMCGCRRGAFLEGGSHGSKVSRSNHCGALRTAHHAPPVRFHWKTTAALPRRSCKGRGGNQIRSEGMRSP
ncbi:MAG: hypothetical protein CM15mP18_3800 [Methanobacteriota archaeon]|nr:MAG: hypothetical protein CM15mP18_3800 [Euryarchaeota archaeon]